MRLFIQIPCYNEAGTLAKVINDLPRQIDGVDEIHTVVVDDGSSDRTVEVAKRLGVDYIQLNRSNVGLAQTFARGLETCLFLGADVVVNTDGDNQYSAADIPKLVEPVLAGSADLVVGCRDIAHHKEFSFVKKLLHRIGSRIVARLSGVAIPDATSGFRAFGRHAATRLAIMSRFSYTLETLIQAGRTGLRIGTASVGVNPRTRPSRLFRSIPSFIARQLRTMFGVHLFYFPLRFFGRLSLYSFLIAAGFGVRTAYYLWFAEEAARKFKVGSGLAVIGGLFLGAAFLVGGLLGSVMSGLRNLMEDTRYRVRSLQLSGSTPPPELNIVRSPELFRWKRRLPPDAAEPVDPYQPVGLER